VFKNNPRAFAAGVWIELIKNNKRRPQTW